MNVTIVRFSSLGDCVLLCPLPRHLKNNGATSVTVVTKSAYADLFAATDGVDRVRSIASGSFSELLALARELKSQSDVVIDAHNTIRSRVFCAKLGKVSARFDKRYRQRLGMIVFKSEAVLPSILEQFGSLAEDAGFPPASLEPGGLRLDDHLRDAAAKRLTTESKWVAIAPGSRWRSKRWPAEQFCELSTLLVHAGYRIVLLGDIDDREAAQAIVDVVGDSAVDATGSASLLESAALVSRCDRFVGNDSGLAHIAEAVGVPVITTFGPTVTAFGYGPSLPDSRTVSRKLGCRPCSRNGSAPCVRGNNECIDRIPVDAVWNAFTSSLETHGERHVVVD